MKRYLFYIFLLITFYCLGCKALDGCLNNFGGIDEIRENAILDFSNRSKLYSQDSIFSIKIDSSNKDIVIVRIGRSSINLLYRGELIGSKSNFPSKIFEKNGKLFYWRDYNYSLSKEVLDRLRNYNLVQEDLDSTLILPDYRNVGDASSSYYFFCKKNIKKYKRVDTKRTIDFNEVKFKCSN